MLQGERDLATVSNLIMSELAPLVNAQYGVFYVTRREEEETELSSSPSYGAESHEELRRSSTCARAWSAGRRRQAPDPAPGRARRLHQDRIGPRPGRAGQHQHPAGLVRG